MLANANSIKTDLFTIEAYDCLPCSTKTFRIRSGKADSESEEKFGIKAEAEDFGRMEDTDKKHAEPYCCGCMKFIPDRSPKEGVLEKYGITRKQWTEIKNALKEVLFVGRCAWCE